MNSKKPKIRYDQESKVLSIEVKKAKSVDSDIQGNVVLDYDRRGEIARINLYNFSFDAFRQSRKALRRLDLPIRITQ